MVSVVKPNYTIYALYCDVFIQSIARQRLDIHLATDLHTTIEGRASLGTPEVHARDNRKSVFYC
jgi:hypothetical protein